MPHAKPLRLLLGLRLRDPASEAAVRAAEAFLEEASSLGPGPGLPLSWNLPLAPLELARGRAAADLTAAIKTRVRSGPDSVLLMGYSGAPHPLLSSEELDKELAWCRRNPWGAGARGLLGQDPRHLLPAAADLLRENRDGVYARHGFESVGLAAPAGPSTARAGGRGSFRYPSGPGRALLYAAWLLSPGWLAQALLAAAVAACRGPLFLLLEPAEPAGPLLAPVLQALEARFQPQFLSLEEALASEKPARDTEAARPAPDPLPLLSPAALEAASRVEALRARARRRSDADLRAVLETLAGPETRSRGSARARDARRKPEPTLVAAMSGLVTLQGDGVTATFSDGRLSGLQRTGDRPAVGWAAGDLPAESYLVAEGRLRRLETESAFSFELGGNSGLRSVLKTGLAGGEVELEMQAFFPEGQKQLELGFRLRFPELPEELALEAVVPFEVPVLNLARGQGAELTGEQAGGGSVAETLEGEQVERLYTGACFRLRPSRGGPALVLASCGRSGVLVLRVRTARTRRGLRLLASPYGAHFPAPARLYSGRTLSFCLRLGLEN